MRGNAFASTIACLLVSASRARQQAPPADLMPTRARQKNEQERKHENVPSNDSPMKSPPTVANIPTDTDSTSKPTPPHNCNQQRGRPSLAALADRFSEELAQDLDKELEIVAGEMTPQTALLDDREISRLFDDEDVGGSVDGRLGKVPEGKMEADVETRTEDESKSRGRRYGREPDRRSKRSKRTSRGRSRRRSTTTRRRDTTTNSRRVISHRSIKRAPPSGDRSCFGATKRHRDRSGRAGGGDTAAAAAAAHEIDHMPHHGRTRSRTDSGGRTKRRQRRTRQKSLENNSLQAAGGICGNHIGSDSGGVEHAAPPVNASGDNHAGPLGAGELASIAGRNSTEFKAGAMSSFVRTRTFLTTAIIGTILVCVLPPERYTLRNAALLLPAVYTSSSIAWMLLDAHPTARRRARRQQLRFAYGIAKVAVVLTLCAAVYGCTMALTQLPFKSGDQ